eukprot:gene15092-biopygen668
MPALIDAYAPRCSRTSMFALNHACAHRCSRQQMLALTDACVHRCLRQSMLAPNRAGAHRCSRSSTLAPARGSAGWPNGIQLEDRSPGSQSSKWRAYAGSAKWRAYAGSAGIHGILLGRPKVKTRTKTEFGKWPVRSNQPVRAGKCKGIESFMSRNVRGQFVEDSSPGSQSWKRCFEGGDRS